MAQQYDPVGALGGLFAPAWIYGDPVSQAAVEAWNAAHLKTPPPPDVQPQNPSKSVEEQRNAIVAAMMSNSQSPIYTAGGLGAPSGEGFSLGSPSGLSSSPTGFTSSDDAPANAPQQSAPQQSAPPSLGYSPPSSPQKGTPQSDAYNALANSIGFDPGAMQAAPQQGFTSQQGPLGPSPTSFGYSPPSAPQKGTPQAEAYNSLANAIGFDPGAMQAAPQQGFTSQQGPLGPSPTSFSPDQTGLEGINSAIGSLAANSLNGVPGINVSLTPFGIPMTVPNIALNQVDPTPENPTLAEALDSTFGPVSPQQGWTMSSPTSQKSEMSKTETPISAKDVLTFALQEALQQPTPFNQVQQAIKSDLTPLAQQEQQEQQLTDPQQQNALDTEANVTPATPTPAPTPQSVTMLNNPVPQAFPDMAFQQGVPSAKTDAKNLGRANDVAIQMGYMNQQGVPSPDTTISGITSDAPSIDSTFGPALAATINAMTNPNPNPLGQITSNPQSPLADAYMALSTSPEAMIAPAPTPTAPTPLGYAPENENAPTPAAVAAIANALAAPAPAARADRAAIAPISMDPNHEFTPPAVDIQSQPAHFADPFSEAHQTDADIAEAVGLGISSQGPSPAAGYGALGFSPGDTGYGYGPGDASGFGAPGSGGFGSPGSDGGEGGLGGLGGPGGPGSGGGLGGLGDGGSVGANGGIGPGIGFGGSAGDSSGGLGGPAGGVSGTSGQGVSVGAPGAGVGGFGEGASGVAGVSGAGALGGGIGIGGLGGLGGSSSSSSGGPGSGGEGGEGGGASGGW